MLESKQLYLEKIHTSEKGLDMLTECLPKEKLEACRQSVSLVEPTAWGRGGDLSGLPHFWARPMG